MRVHKRGSISMDQLTLHMQCIIHRHMTEMRQQGILDEERDIKVERIWRDESGWICVAYSNHLWSHYSAMGEWW